MELQFDITRRFEKDLKRLTPKDQDRVAASIDKYASIFDIEHGDPTRHIYQPHKILLPEGLDSSLYVLRATDQIRVVLTIEDDPLFGRKVVTLIRVVKHDDLERAFNSIAEALYQHLHTGGQGNG
jgi:mRNA-degrading endonuclease RelE of RelBE toxin-antitoxin system